MPIDWQSILVYVIVLLTLGWLVGRGRWRRRGSRSDCGKDCGCGGSGVRRDPAIQRFLERRRREQEK